MTAIENSVHRICPQLPDLQWLAYHFSVLSTAAVGIALMFLTISIQLVTTEAVHFESVVPRRERFSRPESLRRRTSTLLRSLQLTGTRSVLVSTELGLSPVSFIFS